MQFAVQACVQGMAMPFHIRHQIGAATVARGASARIGTLREIGFAGRWSRGGTLSSQFLAPGLDSLQLPLKPSACNGGSVGSVRAEAGPGAYDRETFVDANEAAKIAHVRDI